MKISDPWNPDDREIARRMRSRQRCSRRLGFPLPQWLPEESAPPVDVELLQGLYAGELDDATEREVVMRIWKYRSWAEAQCRMALERYLRHKRHEDQK